MSSSICLHFTQNAWRKDLCSNCFKSRGEHKQPGAIYDMAKNFSTSSSKKCKESGLVCISDTDKRKPEYPDPHKTPEKGIIKKNPVAKLKSRSRRVCFSKNLYEVIGYGGEWSDTNHSVHDDVLYSTTSECEETVAASTDDEETMELKRITRANTDFNMNNGNLLGDPHENMRKSFNALRLGVPQVDKEGKKQTLKISVVPFGTSSFISKVDAAANTKKTAALEGKTEIRVVEEAESSRVLIPQMQATSSNSVNMSDVLVKPDTAIVVTPDAAITITTPTLQTSKVVHDNDGKNSPPIERAMEKSLLDEISETLQQNETKKRTAHRQAVTPNMASKIKFEITSLADSVESKQFFDLKRPIARNIPITKDQMRPKVSSFQKFSNLENDIDVKDVVSAYYDLVVPHPNYENYLSNGKCRREQEQHTQVTKNSTEEKSAFTSSQYITDMLLSSKTRCASYSLHENSFVTSKITSDGLIVTKCSTDDILDSTSSSFDGSSDEETYNMIRSESDSGIGIKAGSNYKKPSLNMRMNKDLRPRMEVKSVGISSIYDYEDINVAKNPAVIQAEVAATEIPSDVCNPSFNLEKSRELHGEPDGSADPDGSMELKEASIQAAQLPALPKSPSPAKVANARHSFLYGLPKKHQSILLKKPDIPIKPIISQTKSTLKTFEAKRQPSSVEQVIDQIQQVMTTSLDTISPDPTKDDSKLRKGRAPNPPVGQNMSKNLTLECDAKLIEQSLKSKERAYDSKLVPIPVSIAGEIIHRDSSKLQDPDTNDAKMDPLKQFAAESTSTENILDCLSTSTLDITLVSGLLEVSSSSSNACNPATGCKVSDNSIKNEALTAAREKENRERVIVHPKFRNLNSVTSHRSSAPKNLELQPSTPEPTLKVNKANSLSMSEGCLVLPAKPNSVETTATYLSKASCISKTAADKKSLETHTKCKTKFSLKKFLRMGVTKTTDNLHRREDTYSEICTGDESGVVGKPRLVIIHPIDMNPTAVEVVKDIVGTSDVVVPQTISVSTGRPPVPPLPPLRSTGEQRSHEINKPVRPPPPKSVELHRKQIVANTKGHKTNAGTFASHLCETGGSLKCKADNVYANLGEIRSSIAPRKPERTASMREREAQLELARKRYVGRHNENTDDISISSLNGENVLDGQQQQPRQQFYKSEASRHQFSSESDRRPPECKSISAYSYTGPPECRSDQKIGTITKIASSPLTENYCDSFPGRLKNSERKMNNKIDCGLVYKGGLENMYEFVKTAESSALPIPRVVETVTQSCASPCRGPYSKTTSVLSLHGEMEPVHFAFNNSLANLLRITSASCPSSEIGEFDVYSPYSYYGSEAGCDVAHDINDTVWGISSANSSRIKPTNRLRIRKGRSVVHKTIEDNYTAVVVANHEALAEVLDQLQQTPNVSAALRPLVKAINLRFEDFTILNSAQAFVVGRKAFHAALWNTAPITLALSADSNQLLGLGGELNQLSGGVCGVLNPITEFCDLVPSYYLPCMPSSETTLLQATISVLPRLKLDSLQSIGATLKGKSQLLNKSNFNFRGSIPNLTILKDVSKDSNAVHNVVSVQNLSTLNEGQCMDPEEGADKDRQPKSSGLPAFDDVMSREVAFIMLQLVNGMKSLQAKVIEEMPLSLSNVMLAKDADNKDEQARLCVLQSYTNDDEPLGSLCRCAHIALREMLPTTKISPILADILLQERTDSLSKSKSVLEFVLWGPSDVELTGSSKDCELALQRWLDLERATTLHGLVRTHVELTVYDECHLMFLVRSNAKMLNEAAKTICNYLARQLKGK